MEAGHQRHLPGQHVGHPGAGDRHHRQGRAGPAQPGLDLARHRSRRRGAPSPAAVESPSHTTLGPLPGRSSTSFRSGSRSPDRANWISTATTTTSPAASPRAATAARRATVLAPARQSVRAEAGRRRAIGAILTGSGRPLRWTAGDRPGRLGRARDPRDGVARRRRPLRADREDGRPPRGRRPPPRPAGPRRSTTRAIPTPSRESVAPHRGRERGAGRLLAPAAAAAGGPGGHRGRRGPAAADGPPPRAAPIGRFAVDWIPVPPGSPYAGRSIATAGVRSITGVSIVAVLRADAAFPSPGPDFRLEAGDTALVVGTPDGVEALIELLED